MSSNETGTLSPLSSASTNSRRQRSTGRKNAVSQAPPSSESLYLPTLSGVGDDQEWRRFPFASELKDSMLVIREAGSELEVAFRPQSTPSHNNDNNNDNIHESTECDAATVGGLSFEELERKTDQIIHEARMAVLKQRESTNSAGIGRYPSPLMQGPMKLRPSLVPATPDSPDTHRVHASSRDQGEATVSALLESTSSVHALTPIVTADGRPPLSPMTHSGPTARPPTNVHMYCPSPAESTLGSIDDDEKAMEKLPFQVAEEGFEVSREKVLRRIDGLVSPVATSTENPLEDLAGEDENSIVSSLEVDYQNLENVILADLPKRAKKGRTVVIESTEAKKASEETQPFVNWFSFLWGGPGDPPGSLRESGHVVDENETSLFPMACGSPLVPMRADLPAIPSSLIRVASGDNVEGYAKVVHAQEFYIDPRMPEWIDNQFIERDSLPNDGTYHLGESRTVIVHELIRGSWTWCIAWSPDGRRLAIGTENHHLAVVDTFSSTVWRVKHDVRVTGPTKGIDVTHSIRSIAWGSHFIAIGGVGGSVSILSPNDPYPILHRITATGFVGSLDWLRDTTTLVIGSRNGQATIVKIFEEECGIALPVIDRDRKIRSVLLHTIDRESAWINAVKFSPGGKAIAIGDSKGILGIYGYKEPHGHPVSVTNIANFKFEDSILAVEWSPDGQWLYAGGEDFCVTIINTPTWEAVHRIKRDRWVQFISASHGCSHVAIGGVSSEVSIMDVDLGWDAALNVSLKGLVPLSAKWHPQDQYLVVTGQTNSVLGIETTNSRYVSGHFLRSTSPILAIQFSPDGSMVAIGNEAGIVTIFKLSGTTFITTYELVLDGDGSLSIAWSKNGTYIAVVAGRKVVIIAKSSAPSGSLPPNSSGFRVSQVIRHAEMVHDVALSPDSRYAAVSGFKKTRFLDAASNFKCILEIANEGTSISNAWSPDGCWFATIGKNQHLLIYDTSSSKPSEWTAIFTVETAQTGLALAWGPAMVGGLQYVAYGGEGSKVYIMEIRTKEQAWETVLGIPREGVIRDLDWNGEGLLAAAVGNGTVSVMDLSYLQSGWAVNEMDYNWQRQALTCFTEIRRNKGKNSMKSVRWIPSSPGSESLLACGGTDGEVEIIDLTDRRRCVGYNKAVSAVL
jgi:WD40 repeat protein